MVEGSDDRFKTLMGDLAPLGGSCASDVTVHAGLCPCTVSRQGPSQLAVAVVVVICRCRGSSGVHGVVKRLVKRQWILREFRVQAFALKKVPKPHVIPKPSRQSKLTFAKGPC